MASMDITNQESGFQTPTSKKKKASSSPCLPPRQPFKPPTNYKNRTLLLATGIDPNYNSQIRIMSDLKQYHPNLKSFQDQAVPKSWIF